ncbi:uncharacterized protein LOC123439698 [Hordeum vulgare subsp. vulgare]|uniref:Predicted protein n=1 Tax=Hordeum vulgare subsp. vulgare TaxID=112509 RepID=F2DBK4_HORVV|nr:uncharacterized protein LOC123439698 [Hordeum vulgare subsp. vulgare]BAJ92475.1 predicted protein [Hordeum vulgare subsp. vulgare]
MSTSASRVSRSMLGARVWRCRRMPLAPSCGRGRRTPRPSPNSSRLSSRPVSTRGLEKLHQRPLVTPASRSVFLSTWTFLRTTPLMLRGGSPDDLALSPSPFRWLWLMANCGFAIGGSRLRLAGTTTTTNAVMKTKTGASDAVATTIVGPPLRGTVSSAVGLVGLMMIVAANATLTTMGEGSGATTAEMGVNTMLQSSRACARWTLVAFS